MLAVLAVVEAVEVALLGIVETVVLEGTSVSPEPMALLGLVEPVEVVEVEAISTIIQTPEIPYIAPVVVVVVLGFLGRGATELLDLLKQMALKVQVGEAVLVVQLVDKLVAILKTQVQVAITAARLLVLDI